jgi:hypothetical protein
MLIKVQGGVEVANYPWDTQTQSLFSALDVKALEAGEVVITGENSFHLER